MNLPLHMLCDPAPHDIRFLPDKNSQFILRTSSPVSIWHCLDDYSVELVKNLEYKNEVHTELAKKEVAVWYNDYCMREDSGEYD